MNKVLVLSLGLFLLACSPKQNVNTAQSATTETTIIESTAPQFNADSAYQYTAAQVDFGYRIPNTDAHKNCGNYFVSQLKSFGAQVFEQEAILTAYDGTKLQTKNIIGSFNPDSKSRILLFAHWDTRPYSDHDPNPTNYKKPLDGADDGASGCGILLEIARQVGMKAPNAGVDIIFFDAEDYGIPQFAKQQYQSDDSWCLGSAFWAKNPHVPNYKADFGILLDMVGAKDATFYIEYISKRYASRYAEEIWSAARDLGYGKYFINSDGGAITDDHEQVIKGRGIPCVDIINYDPNSEKGFADYWHTQNDNMSNISKETLKAVGQTVLQVVYNKK